MAVNWVMLDDAHTIVPLPRERILHASPPRIALAIETSNSYPGREPFAIHCSSGKAFLTNQRLVYLPAEPTHQFKSFSAPILNFQDTLVTAPFFGPNAWVGILQPVTGGGIPSHHAFLKIKMTFKEGGAFDFQSTYEQIKETLSQASEIARESGHPVDHSVDLEQLPAYEEVGGTIPVPSPPPIQQPTPISPICPARPSAGGIPTSSNGDRGRINESSEQFPPPNEPPPGYDEVQISSIAEDLEESIRRAQ